MAAAASGTWILILDLFPSRASALANHAQQARDQRQECCAIASTSLWCGRNQLGRTRRTADEEGPNDRKKAPSRTRSQNFSFHKPGPISIGSCRKFVQNKINSGEQNSLELNYTATKPRTPNWGNNRSKSNTRGLRQPRRPRRQFCSSVGLGANGRWASERRVRLQMADGLASDWGNITRPYQSGKPQMPKSMRLRLRSKWWRVCGCLIVIVTIIWCLTASVVLIPKEPIPAVHDPPSHSPLAQRSLGLISEDRAAADKLRAAADKLHRAIKTREENANQLRKARAALERIDQKIADRARGPAVSSPTEPIEKRARTYMLPISNSKLLPLTPAPPPPTVTAASARSLAKRKQEKARTFKRRIQKAGDPVLPAGDYLDTCANCIAHVTIRIMRLECK